MKNRGAISTSRPADVALAVARLVMRITRLVYTLPPYSERSFIGAQELMVIAFRVLMWTGDGERATVNKLVDDTGISRSQVQRHLNTLIKNGRVKKIGHDHHLHYISDMEFLDGVLTNELIAAIFSEIENTYRSIRRHKKNFLNN